MQLQNSYKANSILLILGGLFLILLFYLPLSLVLKSAIYTNEGGLTLKNITQIISSEYHRRIISFTLFQALLSTLFTIILGLPGAWLLATKDFPGKKLLKAVSAVPLYYHRF
jgi:thiamine transport system permease protein